MESMGPECYTQDLPYFRYVEASSYPFAQSPVVHLSAHIDGLFVSHVKISARNKLDKDS